MFKKFLAVLRKDSVAAKLANGAEITPVMVETQEALEKACSAFRSSAVIAVDTEFIRTRTFFPQLGLIQVCDDRNVYIIDPLALEDLTPFSDILVSPGVVKIFHSCAEDLEVLHYLCGAVPGPVFDTQVAASFCGHGFQISYQGLVKALIGIELEKGETRSNWLKRPLTENQVKYAAMDVACLIPMREALTRQLKSAGRLAWVEEEFEYLRDAAHFDSDPEEYYLRLGCAWQFRGRDLALLRDLFAWREREAAGKDLPRNFIMKDKVLRVIARKKPMSRRQLAAIEDVKPSQVRKFGGKIVKVVKNSSELPDEALPTPVPRPPSPRKVGQKVEVLRQATLEVAERLQLPAELVARKRQVTELVRSALSGAQDPLPRELSGWRREIIGNRLLSLLDER